MNRIANESRFVTAGRYAFLVLMSLVALGPLAWSVLTSLKPPAQVMAYPPVWIPSPPS